MSSFDKSFDYVVGREGTFDDDPQDDGNWTGGKQGAGELKGTKFGISAAAYPNEDIQALTLERAKLLYRHDYWDKLECDTWDPRVAFVLFDAAVNQGVDRAKRMLQRAVGVNDDGKIGPHTRSAVRLHSPETFIEYFQAERILEYAQAARWERFKRGWARRVIGTAISATR